MKLTTGHAHDLYAALITLDREDTLKFTADVRLKIATNINLLAPQAGAYERARVRVAADLNAANRVLPAEARRSDAELQADLAEGDASMRAAEVEVELKTFTRPDLKLDENQKLGGATLARLMPAIEGLE